MWCGVIGAHGETGLAVDCIRWNCTSGFKPSEGSRWNPTPTTIGLGGGMLSSHGCCCKGSPDLCHSSRCESLERGVGEVIDGGINGSKIKGRMKSQNHEEI